MIHVIKFRLLLSGLTIWIAATAALRIGGQYVLHPGGWANTVVLFAASFVLMGIVVRRIIAHLPAEQGLAGAFSIALPTLLLDPFSSAFFPVVFPNMSPEVAGVFGGWMLCCCAGAFVGAAITRRKQS